MAEQEDRHWWFAGRREIIARLIERCLGETDAPRLLEVGCGTGGNLSLLSGYGALDAVEYDDEARRLASEKSGIQVMAGGLPGPLPLEDERYDLVGLFDVLEHVEEDVASLAALRQKLSARGRLLVTVPALPWLWSEHDVSHHHFRRYTIASLSAAADEAGLAILECGYFNTFLFPAIVATRFLKKVAGSHSPDDGMPAESVNATLKRIFASESHLVGRVSLPVGTSLYLIAERPAAALAAGGEPDIAA